MKKIIISFLGTGILGENRSYKKTKYCFEDSDNIFESSFMVEAIRRKEDVKSIIIIGTANSMWEELYRVYIGEDNHYLELDEKIQKKNINQEYLNHLFRDSDIHCILINNGVNKKEVLFNLNIVFDALPKFIDDGDEVILDITHSFRSIPVLMYSVLEFIKVTKNIKTKIYYGMYEFAHDNKGIAPAVNLSSYYNLLDWSKAVNNFIKYGDGEGISELIKERNQDISNKLTKITNSFCTMQLTSVKEDLLKLEQLINAENGIPELNLFKSHIVDFINRFKNINKLSFFQLEVAKWYAKNKFYALSYLVLTEAIITRVGEIMGKKQENYDERKEVKDILTKETPYIYHNDIINKFNSIYLKVRDERNVIAHAASFHNADHASSLIVKIKRDLEQVEKLFNS